MTRTLILHLLLLATAPIVVPADTPTSFGIHDNGNFFSAEAKQKAAAALKEIATGHRNTDVLIETYNELPGGQNLRAFSVDRAASANLKGLYVVIIRKGGMVGVLPEKALTRAFTERASKALREQITAGLRKGPENFDKTLLDAITSIMTTLDAAPPPAVATSGPATQSAGGTSATATRPARSRADQILDALTGDVPELRKAAADVLRSSAASDPATAQAAVPRLLEMLRSPDPGARVTAADLLGEIGKAQPELVKPAVAPLVDALRDVTSNDVRRAAARALGSAGPTAREQAAAALKTAAENDADPGVRQDAAAALKALDGDKQ